MKHIRWMISMGLLGVSTHVARELHGWNGFWLVMVVMIVFGLVNFFDGYFARKHEPIVQLAEALQQSCQSVTCRNVGGYQSVRPKGVPSDWKPAPPPSDP